MYILEKNNTEYNCLQTWEEMPLSKGIELQKAVHSMPEKLKRLYELLSKEQTEDVIKEIEKHCLTISTEEGMELEDAGIINNDLAKPCAEKNSALEYLQQNVFCKLCQDCLLRAGVLPHDTSVLTGKGRHRPPDDDPDDGFYARLSQASMRCPDCYFGSDWSERLALCDPDAIVPVLRTGMDYDSDPENFFSTPFKYLQKKTAEDTQKKEKREKENIIVSGNYYSNDRETDEMEQNDDDDEEEDNVQNESGDDTDNITDDEIEGNGWNATPRIRKRTKKTGALKERDMTRAKIELLLACWAQREERERECGIWFYHRAPVHRTSSLFEDNRSQAGSSSSSSTIKTFEGHRWAAESNHFDGQRPEQIYMTQARHRYFVTDADMGDYIPCRLVPNTHGGHIAPSRLQDERLVLEFACLIRPGGLNCSVDLVAKKNECDGHGAWSLIMRHNQRHQRAENMRIKAQATKKKKLVARKQALEHSLISLHCCDDLAFRIVTHFPLCKRYVDGTYVYPFCLNAAELKEMKKANREVSIDDDEDGTSKLITMASIECIWVHVILFLFSSSSSSYSFSADFQSKNDQENQKDVEDSKSFFDDSLVEILDEKFGKCERNKDLFLGQQPTIDDRKNEDVSGEKIFVKNTKIFSGPLAGINAKNSSGKTRTKAKAKAKAKNDKRSLAQNNFAITTLSTASTASTKTTTTMAKEKPPILKAIEPKLWKHGISDGVPRLQQFAKAVDLVAHRILLVSQKYVERKQMDLSHSFLLKKETIGGSDGVDDETQKKTEEGNKTEDMVHHHNQYCEGVHGQQQQQKDVLENGYRKETEVWNPSASSSLKTLLFSGTVGTTNQNKKNEIGPTKPSETTMKMIEATTPPGLHPCVVNALHRLVFFPNFLMKEPPKEKKEKKGKNEKREKREKREKGFPKTWPSELVGVGPDFKKMPTIFWLMYTNPTDDAFRPRSCETNRMDIKVMAAYTNSINPADQARSRESNKKRINIKKRPDHYLAQNNLEQQHQQQDQQRRGEKEKKDLLMDPIFVDFVRASNDLGLNGEPPDFFLFALRAIKPIITSSSSSTTSSLVTTNQTKNVKPPSSSSSNALESLLFISFRNFYNC